jgi:capsular exopolysaccharide synthesis family protein
MALKSPELEHDGQETLPVRSGTNFLALFWRRKALLATGLVVGLVLGGLYYSQQKPVYQAAAQVLVVKKRPDTLPLPGNDGGYAYWEDYLATHLKLIKSPLILSRAARRKELQGLASFAGQSNLTGAIQGGLQVNRDKESSGGTSNILDISFRGPVAEDCPVVVNAVIESYKDFLDETYRNVSDNTLELIRKASKTLKDELAGKEQKRAQFLEKNPVLWRGKEGTSPLQERLASIEARVSTLLVRRAEMRATLDALEKAVKEGRSRAELLALIPLKGEKEKREDDASTRPLEEELLKLKLEQELLLENYGKDHPQVRAAGRRIALTEKLLKAREERAAETGGGSGPRTFPGRDPVQRYMHFVRQELHDADVSCQGLSQLLERQKNEARELARYETQDEAIRTDIQRTAKLYDSIIKRLEEINIVRDFGGYDAKTIAPPGIGGKVAPKLWQTVIGGAVLGLLLGAGLAYLAEVSDKSFRTPDEIRRRLGLPIVGHIPFLTPGKEALARAASAPSALDPLLYTVFHPKSVEAEAYRAVRTALYFSNSAEEQQVIQITSPVKGDGKSTLAANLAVAIGQSGKRVLLIDADFRRPRLHKMFGLANGKGLASVIAGTAPLPEAIQKTVVQGLSLLPCGPLPPNPAELLTSPRFKELVTALREEFDFVIIDTPPLLAVTDPCVVTPCVDGIYLTVRLTKNARPQAERAKEILATLGAKVLGVVVNGMTRAGEVGGYGYGPGQYGYGYGYDNYEESEAGDEDDGAPTAPGESDGPNGPAQTAVAAVAPTNGHGNGSLAPPAQGNGVRPHRNRSRRKESRGFLRWLFNR